MDTIKTMIKEFLLLAEIEKSRGRMKWARFYAGKAAALAR